MPRWPVREQKIAAWIATLPQSTAIHDYGCGDEQPMRAQVGGRPYVGIDKVGSGVVGGGAAVALDLNDVPALSSFQPPGDRASRAALAIGLLEYLDDVNAFVRWLASHYDTVLLTYVCATGGARLESWKNHHTADTLLAILRQHFAIATQRPDIYGEGTQTAFLCTAPPRTRPVWVSITGEGRINFGNDIIEAAIDQLIPGLKQRCDVRSLWRLEGCPPPSAAPFVFVPGSTCLHLQPLINWVSNVAAPVYVLGGSAQCATPQQLAFWKRCDGGRLRVFARDPFTSHALGEAPIVGCPTLFCPSLGYDAQAAARILFSVARVPIPPSFWTSRGFADWTLVLHEDDDIARVPAWVKFGDVVKLSAVSPTDAIRMYQSAAGVVAGRLHSFLPALGRAPAWYYGDQSDVRTTIVPYLGLEVHSPDELVKLDLDAVTVVKPARVDDMAAAFAAAAREIGQ